MKQKLVLGRLLVLVLLVLPMSVMAEVRIGFVNVSKVMELAPQAAISRSILEKEFSPRDKKMVKLRKKIGVTEKKFEKDSAIMSETKRRKAERELVSLKRDFKRQQDEFREDFGLRRNEEMRKLQVDVAKAIDATASKGKFDLIVSEGVVFASKKIDISKRVLEQLKQQASKSKKSKKNSKK